MNIGFTDRNHVRNHHCLVKTGLINAQLLTDFQRVKFTEARAAFWQTI